MPPAGRRGCKPLGHQVAQTREPLSLLGEKLVVGDGTLIEQRLQPAVGRAIKRRAHAGAPSRTAAETSQSRQPSMPSPVRALTSIRSTSGCTTSRL